MLKRLKVLTAVTALAMMVTSARADDVTVSGATNASGIQGTLSGGSGTGTITFTATSTLTMDQALINVTGIIVNNGVTGTIAFQQDNDITFANANAAMTLVGSGALTITGDVTGGGFDFVTTASGKTLTLTSATNTFNTSIQSNRILLGNGNTLKIASGGTPVLNSVLVTSGAGTVDVDASATITSLNNTGATATTIDVAASTTATITTPTLATATTFTGAAADSKLLFTNAGTLTGTVTTSGTGELEIDAASNFTSLVVGSSATTVLDVDGGATFTAFNNTGATATTIDVAASTTLTITTPTIAAACTFTGAAADSKLLFTNAGTLTGTITTAGTGELEVDGASTFTSLVIGSGASSLVDVDNDVVFTAFNNTGATATTLDLIASKTLTITTPTIAAACTLTGAAADSKFAFTNAGTLTGTITTDGTSELEVNGASTFTSLVIGSGDTTVVDVNESATFTAFNNTGATATTIDVASGKTATITTPTLAAAVTFTGADATSKLELDGASTVLALTVATAGYLDIDAATTITTVSAIPAAVTIDVASGITLTLTNGLVLTTKTLTLAGSGTLSKVTATTGTITDNGGSTISDLRITPGSGTFTWNGTGAGTVTDLSNSTFADGNIISKAGTGSLTIGTGVTGFFGTAGTQKVNVTAGTLLVGSAGTNDDITFAQDADELVVSSGATLTTYGSFTVSAAGANVNLDAAAGSTVNLNSTAGAETFTAVANNDFQLLGTTNIAGSNGDYTLGGAYLYQFGDVNVNATGSFIMTVNDGKIEFVPSSTVTLAGNATLTLGSNTDGNEVVLDTIGDTGTFTVDRGSSTNMTLNHLDISRATYTSDTGCPAAADGITVANLDQTTETVNWTGDCMVTPTPTPTPTPEPTPEPTPTPDPIPDQDPVEDTADDAGNVDLANDVYEATVEGVEEGTAVSMDTEAGGKTTITVGDTTAPKAVVVVAGLEEDGDIALSIDENGDQKLVLTNSEGKKALNLQVAGLGDGADIDVTIDDQGNQMVVLTGAGGSTVTLDANSLPEGATLRFSTTDDGAVAVSVTDETGESIDVNIETSGAGDNVVFTITYNTAPASAKVVTGFEGFEDDQSLGGSVTINATGLNEGAEIVVSLDYTDADVTEAGVTESDLRAYVLNTTSGEYEAPGANDKGDTEATETLGDYGVDTSINSAWAVVDTLGTFAVGVPKAEVTPTPTPTPTPNTGLCGSGVAPCGAAGIVSWLAMLAGFITLKRRVRR